ncbi:MAG: hypothetical protein U5R31_02465 [Acidimicrobiia bacterium]|nr:hypothetical protein [Acidimicrobiia bacterium]
MTLVGGDGGGGTDDATFTAGPGDYLTTSDPTDGKDDPDGSLLDRPDPEDDAVGPRPDDPVDDAYTHDELVDDPG